MKTVAILVITLALAAGCATGTPGTPGYSNPLGELQTYTVSDLQAALADAKDHNDLAAVQCYAGLIPIVQSLPVAGVATAPVGAITAFQKARDLSKTVQANAGGGALVQSVNLACAALFNDVQGDLLRLGVKFRP